MKQTLALISLLAIAAVFLFQQGELSAPNMDQQELFRMVQMYDQWKSQYAQTYTATQDLTRFSNFVENLQKIEQYNEEHPEVTLALNQFGAMSSQEYRDAMLLRTRPERPEHKNLATKRVDVSALPKIVDWEKKGAVYKTQNQGHCGSCWAFATIGGLQGLRYIEEGVLELLSAQQVTSCVDPIYLDDKVQGCGGGEARYAYNYTSIYGIESWESYPYQNFEGGNATKCAYNKDNVVFQNEGVGFVPANDPLAMKENLVRQPLSIAVDASAMVFQFYSKGVISSNCGTDLNHAILLVGYNETQDDEDTPYWVVQNSWGTTWGQQGFGKIAMSTKQGEDGVCGINMQVDFPV